MAFSLQYRPRYTPLSLRVVWVVVARVLVDGFASATTAVNKTLLGYGLADETLFDDILRRGF